MRILVVYATRTGTGRTIAERIGKALNADVEQIDDKVNRKGLFGFIRSGFQASTKRCSPIGPLSHDPARYDMTILISPVWAGSLSSPVRTFLRDNGAKLKDAVLVVSHLAPDDPYEKARDEVEKVLGRRLKAFGSICSKEPARLQIEVDLFLKTLVR
jgi:menaquinone-dependent protoporphyrinogen IX oxidase